MCNIHCFLQQPTKMTEVHKCQWHGCRSNSTDIYSHSTTMVSTLPLSLSDFSQYRKKVLLFKINSVGFCSRRVPVPLVSSGLSHHCNLNVSVAGPTRVTEHMRHFIHSQQPQFLKLLCFGCFGCCFGCFGWFSCNPFFLIHCWYSLLLWFCCCCVLDLLLLLWWWWWLSYFCFVVLL